MVRSATVLTALAAGVLLIAGCSSPSSPPDTGGDQGTTSSPDDGGGGSSDGDSGLAKEIPTTFPADVPLIDGEVGAGIDVGTGWSVIILTEDVESSYAEAVGLLEGAGFVSDYSQTGDDGSFGQFQNDAYTVQLTGADQPDYGPSITYLVVIK